MDLDLSGSGDLEKRSGHLLNNQTILKTPEKPPSPVYNYRQNHVTTVLLAGKSKAIKRIGYISKGNNSNVEMFASFFIGATFKGKTITQNSSIKEPAHDKTNKMAGAPSEDSDQPGLCAQWVAKDPCFLHAESKDSYQTGRMPRLI